MQSSTPNDPNFHRALRLTYASNDEANALLSSRPMYPQTPPGLTSVLLPPILVLLARQDGRDPLLQLLIGILDALSIMQTVCLV